MIVKIHKRGENIILAICDKELLGKKFEQGNLILDLSSDFYNGKEIKEEELTELFKSAYIINLVGEKSVNLGIKAGIINKDHIIKIKNIPHAQAVLC